jgi:hypothetical protein
MLVLKKWSYISQQLIVTLSHKLGVATETDSDVSEEITTSADQSTLAVGGCTRAELAHFSPILKIRPARPFHI